MPTSSPAPIRALREEAANAATSPERFAELASHPSKAVRREVAGNPLAPWQVLVALANEPDEQIRLNAASSVSKVPEAQEELSRSSDKWVRAILAHTFARSSGSLVRSVQLTLAEDEFPETRARIAETTNYLDIFETLMVDPQPRVRSGSAANPRIDRDQMERLVTDPAAAVRAATAAVGCLYPDEDQMLRLARDKSKGVQWWALYRADGPLAVVEIIAAEGDEMNSRHAKGILADTALHRSATNLEWRANERARAIPGSFDPIR
jgi:hypothetical protein